MMNGKMNGEWATLIPCANSLAKCNQIPFNSNLVESTGFVYIDLLFTDLFILLDSKIALCYNLSNYN